MVRQPDDEPLAFEPSQVVGGLAAVVGAAQQGGDGADQGGVVATGEQSVNPTVADRTAITRGSPNGSAGACWPSLVDGPGSPG